MQVLETLLRDFNQELEAIHKIPDLLNLKAKFIGKQGPLSDVMKNLKDASAEEKRAIGSKANEIKNAIESLVAQKMLEIEFKDINDALSKNKLDLSLTDSVMDKGLQGAGFHPVAIVEEENEDIFISIRSHLRLLFFQLCFSDLLQPSCRRAKECRSSARTRRR
jgi:phenylalanyl-tRNA synthetase alpha chain